MCGCVWYVGVWWVLCGVGGYGRVLGGYVWGVWCVGCVW